MLLRKLNRVSGCFLVSLNVSCGCRLRAPIAIPARGSRPRSQCGERQDSAGSRATQLQGEQARATRSCAVCGACPPPLRAPQPTRHAPCRRGTYRYYPARVHALRCEALCRLTLCCPLSQVVSTSRRGVGGTMSGWGARWVAVTVESGHFGGAWLSARGAVWHAAPTRRRGCAARLRGAGR